jgi:hypothetical protein
MQGTSAGAPAAGCDSRRVPHGAVPHLSHGVTRHTLAGTLTAQTRHPIWGAYASALLQAGASVPKVCVCV